MLPACTFLERTRFVTYDTHADHSWNVQSRIVLSPRAVEPLEESRSDWKIICELAKKMGYRKYFPWKTEEEAIDHMLKPLGLACEELKKHPDGVIVPVPPFLYTKFKGFFGTIMRRVLKVTTFRKEPGVTTGHCRKIPAHIDSWLETGDVHALRDEEHPRTSKIVSRESPGDQSPDCCRDRHYRKGARANLLTKRQPHLQGSHHRSHRSTRGSSLPRI
ncbi:MAG: hypothetical protein B1H13_11110 [Desulfobacteraceae bacterium 4484_190.3]|nr:MAG: hypothetical protein B1H13_11110 [Desulfobacteraceae bacterium 4484_190.3]